jgi:hypothetical protein
MIENREEKAAEQTQGSRTASAIRDKTVADLVRLLAYARRTAECHALQCALCREFLPELDEAISKAGFDPATTQELDNLLTRMREPEPPK